MRMKVAPRRFSGRQRANTKIVRGRPALNVLFSIVETQISRAPAFDVKIAADQRSRQSMSAGSTSSRNTYQRIQAVP